MNKNSVSSKLVKGLLVRIMQQPKRVLLSKSAFHKFLYLLYICSSLILLLVCLAALAEPRRGAEKKQFSKSAFCTFVHVNYLEQLNLVCGQFGRLDGGRRGEDLRSRRLRVGRCRLLQDNQTHRDGYCSPWDRIGFIIPFHMALIIYITITIL